MQSESCRRHYSSSPCLLFICLSRRDWGENTTHNGRVTKAMEERKTPQMKTGRSSFIFRTSRGPWKSLALSLRDLQIKGRIHQMTNGGDFSFHFSAPSEMCSQSDLERLLSSLPSPTYFFSFLFSPGKSRYRAGCWGVARGKKKRGKEEGENEIPFYSGMRQRRNSGSLSYPLRGGSSIKGEALRYYFKQAAKCLWEYFACPSQSVR